MLYPSRDANRVPTHRLNQVMRKKLFGILKSILVPSSTYLKAYPI